MRGTHAAAFLVTVAGAVTASVAQGDPPDAAAFAAIVADLGDAERSEVAEQALLADWQRAQPALAKLFATWDTTTPRDLDRLCAALRAVHLAGTASDDVATALQQAAETAFAALRRSERPPERLGDALTAAAIVLLPAHSILKHHGAWLAARGAETAAWMGAYARSNGRQSCRPEDAGAARDVLARDELGAREVACTVLGATGDASDAALLRERLLARDRPPSHEVRHNGFLADVTDEFALRAAQAIVRLAPQAPENAIAHATLAVVHPHRIVRLASLRALTGCGPHVADAAPELLRVARGADEELASSALQALFPAAEALGPHRATIAELSNARSPALAARARRLLANVDAAGPAPEPTAAEREAERLRACVASLRDDSTSDTRALLDELRTAGAAAWPFLLARYRRELNAAPRNVVQLLGPIGRHLPDDEHAELRAALLTSNDTWHTPGFGASLGGHGAPDRPRQDAYAMLAIGPPTPAAFAAALEHENSIVRRHAAAAVTDDETLVANAASSAAARELVAALLVAARATHPTKVVVKTGPGSTLTFRFDVTDEIRTLAATALIPAPLGGDDASAMLGVLDKTGDATVARAVRAWGKALGRSWLEPLATDPRREIAAAATAVLATLSPRDGK